MRSLRKLVAASVAAGALVAGVATTAGAQEPIDVVVETECDTETGQYITVIGIENFVDEEATLLGGYEASNSEGETVSGLLTWVPNTLPAEGISTSTLITPGDTVLIEIEFVVTYDQFEDENEITIELEGDCEPPPTTTSTSTTTTAPPMERVQPRFTG